MKKLTLYLLVGYPGSGKTTTSQAIHALTGATHIWADYERRAMFGVPTHSKPESKKLYDHLNKTTELLLAEGQSVIFDTNFNFRKDRDVLRGISDKYHADTKLIWIKVPKDVARKRATKLANQQFTRIFGNMPAHDFERLTGNLEQPAADEHPYILDGTKITEDYVRNELKLPHIHKPKSATPVKP